MTAEEQPSILHVVMSESEKVGAGGVARKRAVPSTKKTLFLPAQLHARLKAVSAMSGKSMESVAAEILERSLAEAWRGLLKEKK